MSRHTLGRRGRDDDYGHDHEHRADTTDDRGAHSTETTQGSYTTRETHARDDSYARDKFGGINWGACFFGWLVAIGMMLLLSGIVSAVATAIGANADFTRTDAESNAGTIGIVAAAVLALVLFISYYAGGYVAGRMSRFDGAKQGLGVWIIGLLVTVLAIVLGAVFGSDYNILNRVDMPAIPVSTDELGWGAAITAVVVLAVTLIGALLGGKMGHRYHNKVDRAAAYTR